MALQADVVATGNISVSGAYIKITNLHIIEQYTETENVDNEENFVPIKVKSYKLVYKVSVYKDEDTRDSEGPTVPCPSVDGFKCDYILEDGNPYIIAYEDLKTRLVDAIDC